MRLLNDTQIEQVSGGTIMQLLLEMHQGAVDGWNEPVKSSWMPFPFKGKEMWDQCNNAFKGAVRALGKHILAHKE